METTRIYLLKTKDEDIKQLSFLDEITGVKFIPRIGESILHKEILYGVRSLVHSFENNYHSVTVVCEKIMNV